MIVFVVLALTPVRGYIRAHFLTCSFYLIAHYLCIKIVSCFTFHRSLFRRSNSQSVSIGLGNGLMLRRRLARETSHCLSQLWPSLPTHIWVWWKCMASYCWYHNGRTFIISCWRARRVYANYSCYILGRSSSCLIFCNYYSRQNLTCSECQHSFQLSHKITYSRQTSYMENTEQKASWLTICKFENVIKDSSSWQIKFSTYYHPSFIFLTCRILYSLHAIIKRI